MKRSIVNPKLGKHPDFFKKTRVSATQIDEMPDDSDVIIEDWRELSPAELRKAAEASELTDEDYAEMEEYKDEDTTPGGLPRALEKAIYDGLREECLELDEAGRERRAQPFIDELRGWMQSILQQEFGDEDGSDPDERYTDAFQTDLEREIDGSTLTETAEAVSDHAKTIIEDGQIDEETLDELLRDPGLYDIVRRDDEYQRVSGSVWSYSCGVKEDQFERGHVDGALAAMLHGGEFEHNAWGPAREAHERGEPTAGLVGRAVAETVTYPGMSDADLHYALKELDFGEPNVRIQAWGGGRRKKSKHLDSSRGGKDGREGFTVDDLDDGFDISSYQYEGSRIHAILDAERLEVALNEKIEEQGGAAAPKGRETDDIVYEYAGTNTSVAGASARGMYVARLKPKDLRREGATQGICIGTEANGHPRALREGRTQVFSIRTEVGKPKFTIELVKNNAQPIIDHLEAGKDLYGIYLVGDVEAPSLVELRAEAGAWWRCAEVKGKANRRPGFEAGKDVFTKPDDLRLVTDFLLHLGYTPEYLKTVHDIAPGIKAAEESGMDPFIPPPKRIRPHRDPRALTPKENPVRVSPASPAVRRLLAKSRPMGTFRG